MGYVIANSHRTQPHMGTAFNPAKTSLASWDAFSDVDAFVDAVLAELAAMAADGTRSTRSGPKPPLTGAALRKAIMAIWCVTFCGMQWRAIGQLCDIPFGTLYSLFARWTRVAPATQPLDPDVATGLRRYCRSYVAAATTSSLQGTASMTTITPSFQEDTGYGGTACRRCPEGQAG